MKLLTIVTAFLALVSLIITTLSADQNNIKKALGSYKNSLSRMIEK